MGSKTGQGRPRRRRLWRWAVAVLTVLGLGAAVVVLVTPQYVLLGIPQPVDGIAPPVLTDRGAATTIAALRDLDACRLVDPDVLSPGSSGSSGDVGSERTSPHQCKVYGRSGRVNVTVGGMFGARARWSSAPIVVGGVQAYRSRTTGYADACSVAVPVSFVYAIEFDVDSEKDLYRSRGGADACPLTEAVAAAAIPALRAGTGPLPGDAPLAGVDPCAVLAAAGRVDPGRVALGAEPVSIDPGIDQCSMPTGDQRSIDLAVHYRSRTDTAPDDKPSDGTAGAECRREHVVPGPDRTVVVAVTGRDRDCPAVDTTAGRLASVLPTIRSPGPAQRAVRLFAPGEPDLAVTGPCVDLPFPCLEPAPVTLPSDVDTLLSASDTSTSYTCEMAAGPVSRVFGPGLHPTLYGDFCHFVDDRHEIDVAVTAGASFDLRDYGNGGYDASRDLVVAGHEARYRESTVLGDRTYDWTLRPRPGPPDPVADATGRGVLIVSVSTRPPRGELLGPDTMPFDPAMLQRSEALVTDILTTYFG